MAPQTRAATNCTSTPSGIIEWWPGDGSANGIIDGNNGALQGNAVASATGMVGNCFSFDGTNSYVQISDAPELNPANLTIEAWVKFKSLESQGSGDSPAGDQYIVFKQNSRNSSFEGFDLSKTRISGSDRFRFLIASASGQSVEIRSTSVISTGVWYHVAAVRGANTTQLYVNGQLESQGSISAAQDYGTLPLYFGTSGQSFWDHKLNGFLDEVALFNRALSASEIAAEYAAGAAGRCKGAAIVSQSSSQSANIGANVSLSVNATGFGSLSYQWRFNSSDVSGATTSNLALNNIQPANAGTYTVLVASSLGSVTSTNIVLTVLIPPSITTPPAPQTLVMGNNAAFTVAASGTAPLAYQWRFNGTNLAGATGSALNLSNVLPANGGSYAVVVTNAVGSITSATATLTVLVPPSISSQPQSITNAAGATAGFTATSSGTAPMSYQWRMNGSNLGNGGRIGGATSGSLAISAIQFSDAGSYTLVVSNAAGVITSSIATLTVLAAPAIIAPPASAAVPITSNANFTVTAAGSAPLAYQWLFNGANLPGITTTSLTVTNLTAGSAGSYAVVVTNSFGSVTSAPGVLTVLFPPAITGDPQSRTNIPGTTATFSGAANGSAPLGYQWRFNGTPLADGGRISGATTATLAISNVQSGDAGNYSLVVTNGAGSAISQVATLSLFAPPTITLQPVGITVMSGTTVGFTAAATGATPLGYQWRFNGTNIAGATGTALTITDAQMSNGGGYTVLATNLAGSVTSSVATLTIVVPTACLTPLSSLTGWWTGDGNANDIVGGNHGALQGGATANGVGKVGSAFSFDGANSYVQIPDSASVKPANFTIEAWIFFTGLDGPGSGNAPAGDQYIIFKQNSQNSDFEGYDLSKTRISGVDRFRFLVSSGAGQSVEIDSTTAIAAGVWYHVAIVRGPSTMQMYVNGQLESQASVGFAQNYGTLPLYFGTSGQTFWDRKFYGLLDEVSLHGAALSASAIGAVYAAGSAGKCKAPSLTSQPQSATVNTGGNATFSVAALGLTPLGYQWQFNGVNIPGATGTNLTLIAVQPSNAGNYTVIVTNSLGAISSATAILNVFTPPAISAQPSSLTNLAGSDATFTASVTGSAPLSYQWRFNGADVLGATDSSLTLNAVQPTMAGSYQVVITNAAGAITSTLATLTVWVPPTISSQPLSRTNLVGTDAIFAVSASGTPAIGYQWRINGANIPGATSASLTITGAQLGDAGTYAVVVSNPAGAVTSAPAILTMWTLPSITSQPLSRTNLAGTDAVFSVTASGTPPLGYQWQFNNAKIPGATAATLTVSGAQPTNAGNYTVVITNVAGAVTSSIASLTVWVPPAITFQPQSTTNFVGTDALFFVSVTGTQPISYQWRFNGTNVIDGTSPNLGIDNVQTNNVGDYTVIATNIAGSITSTIATLTIWIPPAITSQPQSRTNIAGTDASFNVTVAGTQPLNYQWRKNGANIAGATAATYTVTSVQAANEGSYSVIATNVAGAVTSSIANLTVWTPPTVTLQPQSQTNFAGTFATFTVAAAGTQPLAYQWLRNGINVVGATDPSLTIGNVQAGNTGNYTVVITNIAGATTSTPATLMVWTPPTIVTQPQSRTNLSGTDALFNVGVTGPGPFSYQWLYNGFALPGATGASLLLSYVQTNYAGSYSVIITNMDGGVTSSAATLTVWVLPAFNLQPLSRTNLAGTSVTFTGSASGTQPLGYQWQFNGANISGATGTALSLNSLQEANGGNYTLVATNIAGATTSSVAVLTVWVPAAIAAHPQSRTNLAGSDALFSVTAIGTQPLNYQWQMNGLNISGATTSSLTLNSVQTNNAGSYSVIVTNVAGIVTSAVASLTVWVPPAFTSQPASLTNLAGTSASFSAAAFGTDPLSYQWRFNGTNLADATTSNLILAAVQTNQAGSYTLVITNIGGAATSSVATLAVWVPPFIASQPQSSTNLSGANINLSVVAGGTQPLGYQWLFNGSNLGGASSATLALTNAQLNQAGSYAVILTNVAGALTSSTALITIWEFPAITTQPQSRTNLAGTDAAFSVTATGTQPLSYQWLLNGATIAGATTAALSLNAVQTNNSGNYAVIVTNIAGAATSAQATLTVWVPPAIVSTPQSRTNLVGTAATFTVVAAGTQPLAYQWQFYGTNLPGSTTSSLALSNLQTSQAGAYAVIVTNIAGISTSAPAVLTIWVPPSIVTHPLSLTNILGADVGFSVSAAGTQPLSYQWRFNGVSLAGATGANLTLTNIQPAQAGSYDAVVTNVAGSVTSLVASLIVNVPAPYRADAGAVILVNSHSAKYLDFQRFIQPYLDNFGFPYTVQDISTNVPGSTLTNYAVIIIGHGQLDTNQTYLTPAAQTALSLAVSNGVGLVNFDNNLSSGASPRYQFVQDIFGFTYGSSSSSSSVNLPATEPGSKMQFITSRHPTNDTVTFRSSITMPTLTGAAGVTNVAFSGGKPLVAIRKYGEGRAVQWGSYDWMVSTVLGPMDGLDDLIWRGIVWAGRKPLVMRGMPSLISMRVDDVSGPINWAHIANETGFKPLMAVFLNDVSAATSADIRNIVTNGNATACVHSFSSSTMFYFDHQHETANSDTVQSNNFYIGTQWHVNNGIPISKVCATHYSEIGANAFAGLKNWGMEFVPIEVVPGTVEYYSPFAPWVVAGPYRRYETPQQGQVAWPTFYADWLTVPGHPEMSNQFFNAYSETRDGSSCGEWCPDNDVSGTITRGTTILKRALDSMTMATLFTHEWYFHPTPCCGATTITTNNLRAEFQGISNNIAAYNPVFVTLDYASQYMRATRTARLVSADYDAGSGRVTANFSGRADLDLTVYTFMGEDNAIIGSTTTAPAFTGTVAAVVASLPPQFIPPFFTQNPTNQTVVAGASASLSATAGGTAPFTYQWLFNGSNIAGATGTNLLLPDVQAANAGSYAVMIANIAGSATSTVATLTVLVPPTVDLTPTNETIVSGRTFILSPEVNGSAPMGYEWQFNNSTLPGAQSEVLTLTNLQPEQTGAYNLVVTNAAGSATSAVVNLRVVVPPTITSQPANTLVMVGSSTHLSVTADGTAPLAYQWLLNGTNLNGASGSTLSLANVQSSQTGFYSVLVSNDGGSTNSLPAMLTIAMRPTLFPATPSVSGHFAISVHADVGLNYAVESTTNFLEWNTLTILSNSTGQVDYTDLTTSDQDRRFYRARLVY